MVTVRITWCRITNLWAVNAFNKTNPWNEQFLWAGCSRSLATAITKFRSHTRSALWT